MLPTPILAVMALAAVALVVQSRRENSPKPEAKGQADFGMMTPERQVYYEVAMLYAPASEDDIKNGKVKALEDLADAFEEVGCKDQAIMLRKKSCSRSKPPEIQEARKQVYRDALASNDKAYVERVANAFYEEGCWGAAKELFEYAAGLK